MLKLAVCDDSSLFLEEMEDILTNDDRVEEVTLYENPETLLTEILKKKKEFDAVFMDIELGSVCVGGGKRNLVCEGNFSESPSDSIDLCHRTP